MTKNKKTIFITTSNEFFFAGRVALKLIRRGWNVTFLNVLVDTKPSLIRQLKIATLLGPLNVIKYCIFNSFYKYKLKDYTWELSEIAFTKKLDALCVSGKLFLINYPKKIIARNKLSIYNCHPGKIPNFRGLMPIPRAMLKSDKKGFVCVSTIHLINDQFDMGHIVSEKEIFFAINNSIYEVYVRVYQSFVSQIEDIMSLQHHYMPKILASSGDYRSTISWREILSLKTQEFKESRFMRFIINGGIIGLISWIVQIIFYNFFQSLGGFGEKIDSIIYAISVLLTFSLVVLLNFFIQKRFVFFAKKGTIWVFVASSFFVAGVVTILSYLFHSIFDSSELRAFASFAYPISAITTAPLAYHIKKRFVFGV